MRAGRRLRSAAWAAAALALAGCAGCGGGVGFVPSLDGVETRIAGVDLEGIELAFDVGIANPLPVSIDAPTFDWKLDVAGAALASGKQTKSQPIGASSRSVATVPARISFRDVASVAKGLEGVDEAPYAFSGAFQLPALGQTFRVPFEKSGTFPVVRPPSVSFRSLDTSGLSLTGGRIAVDADLENPNAFGIGLDDLGWTLDLGGGAVGGLRATTLGTVGPKERRSLRLEADVSAVEAVKGLFASKGAGGLRLRPKGSFQTPYGAIPLK
jgi:LEA14-like dessication related protein